MTQVFISYSRKDLDFVEQLAADLQAAGLDVWYDLSNLQGGSRWSRAIEKAIQDSQYVLVVLSPDSIASKWVEEEFLYASELEKKIIPLFYKKCALPFGYRTLHFIDIQGNKYEGNFNEILRSLDVKPVAQKESHLLGESFPPGWEETWQPSFDKTYSASKKSNDSQKQSIKSELKIEKSRPKGKPIQQRWIIVPIVVILVGAVLAGIFGLPKLFPERENILEPTLTLTERVVKESSPTETIKVVEEPSSTPNPSMMSTEVFTPIGTPLPAEITDGFGVEMVLVPAGEFIMGNNDGFDNERPAHTVFLNSFYIDTYEVTNVLYAACVNASVCTPPQETSSYTHVIYYGNLKYNNFPVINVNWNQAKAYCAWRNAQLPTEAQWEKAARNTDERTYPWGNEIDCNKANFRDENEGCIGDTTVVGSYEGGISPFGVYDMAGNVWEIVDDWYDAYPGETIWDSFNGAIFRVVRGGSWFNSSNYIRSSTRSRYDPSTYSHFIGFRCAKDASQ